MKRMTRSKHPLFAKLHHKIVSGEYQRGQKIPTKEELGMTYDASAVTVHRALANLKRSGFIQTKPGVGTFVSPHPPHLCCYGILFPAALSSVRFYRLVKDSAEAFSRSGDGIQFKFYTNMDEGVKAEDYPRLCEDVEMRRLAGLIFVSVAPELFTESPVMQEGELVRFSVSHVGHNSKIPRLRTNNILLISKAFGWFQRRNRRRVAVICEMSARRHLTEMLPNLLQERGLTTKPYWLITPDRDVDSTSDIVQLLLSCSGENRPDALFCNSEMFLDGLVSGLFAANLDLPRELDVVTHCNFPAENGLVMPLRRIGYNIEEVVRLSISNLRSQKKEQLFEDSQILPQFEEDIQPPSENNSQFPGVFHGGVPSVIDV